VLCRISSSWLWRMLDISSSSVYSVHVGILSTYNWWCEYLGYWMWVTSFFASYFQVSFSWVFMVIVDSSIVRFRFIVVEPKSVTSRESIELFLARLIPMIFSISAFWVLYVMIFLALIFLACPSLVVVIVIWTIWTIGSPPFLSLWGLRIISQFTVCFLKNWFNIFIN